MNESLYTKEYISDDILMDKRGCFITMDLGYLLNYDVFK